MPLSRYLRISASRTSNFKCADCRPLGRPNVFPSALRLASASVVLSTINSRSISAAKPNIVALEKAERKIYPAADCFS